MTTALIINYRDHNSSHAQRIHAAVTARYDSSEGIVLSAQSDNLTFDDYLGLTNAANDADVLVAVVSTRDLYPKFDSFTPSSNSQVLDPLLAITSSRSSPSFGKLILVIVEPDEFDINDFAAKFDLDPELLTIRPLTRLGYSSDLENIADAAVAKLEVAASSAGEDLWSSHHPDLIRQFNEQTPEVRPAPPSPSRGRGFGRNFNYQEWAAGGFQFDENEDLGGRRNSRSSRSRDDSNSSSEDEPEGTEVKWSTDSATTTDYLKRDSLARVLDARLREAQKEDSHTSLLVHLDGNWGSGKSTVLMLLANRPGGHC
jgi:hypothetical protein